MTAPPEPGSAERAALAAAACSFSMIATQVAGKATRDALFLSHFDVTYLPRTMGAVAIVTLVTVLAASRLLSRIGPARVVPAGFAVSAVIQLLVWQWMGSSPRSAAIAFYFHVSVVGSVLISWFWSLVSERFDPRAARRRIGRIAAGGTLGGLLGGIAAERASALLPAASLLPILAGLHALCAAATLAMGRPAPRPRSAAGSAAPSGFRSLSRIPYLRNLALVVLGGTVAAALLDYVFKVRAQAAFPDEAGLLRFFALFYTGVAALTFVLQSGVTRRLLERVGIVGTAASLPLTVGIGSLAGLVLPGLPVIGIVRGTESAVRSSLFRSAYELFYTPVPADEKRASKTIIDVGFERLGDALGAGIVQLLLVLGLVSAGQPLIAGAALVGFGCWMVTRRLHDGYVEALERNLLQFSRNPQGAGPDDTTMLGTSGEDFAATLTATQMDVTRMLESQGISRPGTPRPERSAAREASAGGAVAAGEAGGGGTPDAARDPLGAILAGLRSADAARARRTLRSLDPAPPETIPLLIPLLARDALAGDAQHALRRVVDRHVGQLADALLDADEDFTIRRRIPRVLLASRSPRAVAALTDGLRDRRFEVRYQCGIALARLRERAPENAADAEAVLAAIEREARVDRGVWESHRLLDEERGPVQSPFFEEVLRARASRSLEHVFTLLSLVFPQEPLRVAYRGLHTRDETLRGTALEYLESILPPAVHDALWPFLDDARTPRSRSREDVLESLLGSQESILVNLEELRKRRGPEI